LVNVDNNKTNYDLNEIHNSCDKGKSRGPEYSNFNTDYLINYKTIIGFHRLAINGLDTISNQPISINNVVIVCNGEIYNFKQLYQELGLSANDINTNSDCEVIIHMYLKYGMEYTVQQLDGVFAFVLFDFRNIKEPIFFVGRDPYGVRPLFKSKSWKYIGFASEMKQLVNLDQNESIIQFEPSTFEMYKYVINSKLWVKTSSIKYITFPFYKQPDLKLDQYGIDYYLSGIRENFIKAVKKRVDNCERPIACLLSGGLDSSLVTSIVSKLYNSRIETYSIGLQGSEDLKYAKKVADFLGTNHTEIIITEDEFFERIPEVIKVIESYDTTTVRASVGNYLVAEYISQNSEAKVIFNGDGSDELMGGYLYFNAAPDNMNFDKECKRLLKNIHYFDVLRSDRCISSNGLEPRTPFLDRGWVEYYLSIPCHIRNHNNKEYSKNGIYIEKQLIRMAFDMKNNANIITEKYNPTYKEFLPKEILYRKKEAFSDGVSSKTRSWYEIIQERVEKIPENLLFTDVVSEKCNKPTTKEQQYYYYLFFMLYCNNYNHTKIIPYYWMPKFIEATDASARTLSIYK
jgi:asparagine synthase (glutamine-hydrolysing)